VSSRFIPGGALPASRSLIVPTLTGLISELAGLIGECMTHACCFFVIEVPARHRYVQGLIRPGEDLSLESVSNASLGNCCRLHRLDGEQERALAKLGWHPPDAGSPNWYRRLNTQRDLTALAAEFLVRTLAEIHWVRVRSRLNIVLGRAIGGTSRVPVEASSVDRLTSPKSNASTCSKPLASLDGLIRCGLTSPNAPTFLSEKIKDGVRRS
jgi:hypothetical protein